MTEAGAPWRASPVASGATFAARLANASRAAGPPLFFGLRLWVAVCLALYLAFWLELDNPYWAGTTAALVCQPHLGASLRKGWYRMIGTVVGAVALVVLTACFPQDRIAFLVGLALWGAGCAFVATILRNSLALAAQLAGITAAIIATSELGATGGANGEAFVLAVIRCSEICIGIVCAGVVLAASDSGGAQRRLAALVAAISAEIAGGFAGTLALAGPELPDTQPARSELIRRVIAPDSVIEEALGECAQLRYNSPVLQTAVNGLLAAIAGWRAVWVHLTRLSDDQAGQEANVVLRSVPQELRSAPKHGKPLLWMADPSGLRQICEAAIGTLTALPASTPSLRLLTDRTAAVLAAISHALNWAGDARRRSYSARSPWIRIRLRVADGLPSLVNAGRVFVTIGAVELFWIITQWPNGALAVTFAAIGVLLFSARADQAYAEAVGFVVGTALSAALAAVTAFAVLPGKEGFAEFSLAIGLVLVPAGAGMAQPWQAPMFTAIAAFFCFLLAPTNQMSYDVIQFYNRALAIVAGLGIAALSFRVLPPLSPASRTCRLMMLTLRDLRRLALRPVSRNPADWEGSIYSRLSAVPDAAAPIQRAQLS
jgi:uncharacterized membrane protein YccC